jgi:hypothetical protein
MTSDPLRDPATDQPKPPAADAPEGPPVDAAVDAAAIDAGAVEASAAEATTVEVAPAEALAVAVEAPAEPAQPVKVSRRPAVVAGLRRLITFALATALFVTGATLGVTTFQRTRPVALAPDGGIPITAPPSVIAQEFIAALGANDADGMRSSLSAQPNEDLTDEFSRFDIKRILSVETLGTSVDGSRSATEILLRAEKTDGLPFEVNLVILVDGGTIEGFR